jgi:hypothetical protein
MIVACGTMYEDMMIHILSLVFRHDYACSSWHMTIDNASILTPLLHLRSLHDAMPSAYGHNMQTQHVIGHLTMHDLHVLDVL